jgi:hypothetical protein
MPNPNGTPSTLVPAEPGNLLALKHGIWSDRALVDEIAAEREAAACAPVASHPTRGHTEVALPAGTPASSWQIGSRP